MRDPAIDFEVLHHFISPGFGSGVDLESHFLEMPDDCARYMLNFDYPEGCLAGMRQGTRVLETFLDNDGYEVDKIDHLHMFTKSDYSRTMWFPFAENIIWQKERNQTTKTIRTDLSDGSDPFTINFNDLVYVVNGIDAPFVIRGESNWEGGEAYREVGIDAPDGCTDELVEDDTGSLGEGVYSHKVTFGILDTPSDVESNAEETNSVTTDEDNKKIKV